MLLLNRTHILLCVMFLLSACGRPHTMAIVYEVAGKYCEDVRTLTSTDLVLIDYKECSISYSIINCIDTDLVPKYTKANCTWAPPYALE